MKTVKAINVMIQARNIQHYLMAFFLLPMLSGCIYDISDLDAQISEIMARPGAGIAPLPEIKPYAFYVYQSGKSDARDPFYPFFKKSQEEVEATNNTGLTEEMIRELEHRNREELEYFELDSLTMVGTLKNTGDLWAIVMDPERIVHQVKTGNYMGRNIGKITDILEDKIQIREIVQNSEGKWEEREAMLVLTEAIEEGE